MVFRKRKKAKPKLWTKEEEEKLLETLSTYQSNDHWTYGQLYWVWAAVADEMGRSAAAVRKKWQQIRRRKNP